MVLSVVGAGGVGVLVVGDVVKLFKDVVEGVGQSFVVGGKGVSV